MKKKNVIVLVSVIAAVVAAAAAVAAVLLRCKKCDNELCVCEDDATECDCCETEEVAEQAEEN